MSNRKVFEYVKAGSSPFAKWFSALDAPAAAKVAVALYRLEQGNFSNVKSVGKGVSEFWSELSERIRLCSLLKNRDSLQASSGSSI